MAESSWPTVAGSRIITDDQWELMAAGFADDAVISTIADSTVLFADSTGRQVKVRAGKYANVGGHGWYSGTTDTTKTIGANTSGATRIDRVVLGLDRTTWAVTSYVKAGTPGSGVPPTLLRDAKGSSAGKWEISLGQVTVVNGAATISATDVRVDAPLARQPWNMPWGVLARHRRTTSSSTTTGEFGVVRLTTPVLGGRLYRVSTNCVTAQSTSAGDTTAARFRYTIDGSVPSATTSPILGTMQAISPTYVPEQQANFAYYPATANVTLSVLLTVAHVGGVGTASIFADANNPIDVYIEDVGPDPGASGINI